MKKIILVLILTLIPSLSLAGSHSVGVTTAKAQGGGCSGGSDGVVGLASTITTDVDTSSAATQKLLWSTYTPTSDGAVSYCHYYTHHNDAVTRCVLMSSTGTVLDYSAEQTAKGESRALVHAALTQNYCLETGVTYIVGVFAESDAYFGVGVNEWGTGNTLAKEGLSWSTSSFDVSAPEEKTANFKPYVTLNNSADTP